MSTLDFANEHLFGPLGIRDVVWPENLDGIPYGWGELRMKPLDLAKIGLLYLNRGVWDDVKIVPSSWVKQSTRRHVRADALREYYGYQWWIHPSGTYSALGYAGQYLIVSPNLELVVVFTSSLREEDFFIPWRLYERFIVLAVTNSDFIEADSTTVSRLAHAVESFASPITEPAAAEWNDDIRETATTISNKKYILDNNPFGLIGLTFRFPEFDSEQSPSVVEHHAERSLEYRSVGGAWTTRLECEFRKDRVRFVARTSSPGETVFAGRIE